MNFLHKISNWNVRHKFNWLHRREKAVLNPDVNPNIDGRESETRNTNKQPFVDLAPIDHADIEGGYIEALNFAMDSSRISNIALSGPYGSGKSSIISTFKKNTDFRFLTISLAAFDEDEKAEVDIKDIERSIIQQMLYGTSANKLPFSRFKRISTPKHSLPKALIFVIWALTTFYIVLNWSFFFDLDASKSIHWGKTVASIVAIAGITYIFSKVYDASFGHSIKRISLKNAEIETAEISEKSILNYHLDEIIYFFQATDYNAVVFEDLDRFRKPEIFVKLRELSILINESDRTSEQIKFLYALKDDMFSDKDRTKFFDFIIPVIPIINVSNSLDKMQERLEAHEFGGKISAEFLREVSLFLDDLRLIQNIFNELVVYYERLKSDKLDVTKLLAMMIYKNLYPSDFENLHYRRGVLFSVCQNKDNYLRQKRAHLRSQIEVWEKQIEASDLEKVGATSELMRIYLAQITTHVPENFPAVGIVVGDQYFHFSDMLDLENFEKLIDQDDIVLATRLQPHPNHNRSIGVSFSHIEQEVDPKTTFLERRQNVENKGLEFRAEIEMRIGEIENEISRVSRLGFARLVDGAEIDYDQLMEAHDIKEGALLTFLIRDGYLDDNYYQYTSNFHEGRLTLADRDFLLTLRNRGESDPLQSIDNPSEVCINMRQEDFESRYVLNVKLIDYLVTKRKKHSAEIAAAIAYISHHFDHSEDFLTAYYEHGENVGLFMEGIADFLPNFSKMAAASKNHLRHVIGILDFANQTTIVEKMNSDNVISDYISEHGPILLKEMVPRFENFDLLLKLKIQFLDLTTLSAFPGLHDFAIVNTLFRLNPTNVNYVLSGREADLSKISRNLSTSNYTSVLGSDKKTLTSYVEENISTYVNDVLLMLDENTEEDEAAILSLLGNSQITIVDKKKIITQQEHVFDTLEKLPEALWPHVLQERKVTLSWLEVSRFLMAEEADNETLLDAIQHPGYLKILSNNALSLDQIGKDGGDKVSDFIFQNESLGDEEYCLLMNSMPYRYNVFPQEVSAKKVACLSDIGIINLNESTFEFCDSSDELKAKLIASNFDTYIGNKDEFGIDDDIRRILLEGDLNGDDKLKVVEDFSPELAADTEFSSLLADLFRRPNINLSNLQNVELLASVIKSQPSAGVSIELLTKSISKWDESTMMEILSELPYPYKNISEYGRRPTIRQNQTNLEFLMALKSRRFISSYSVTLWGNYKVNTKRIPG